MQLKNNMTYEELKEILKKAEVIQKSNKKWRYYFSKHKQQDRELEYIRHMLACKDFINAILTAIHAHKQARYYYGKLKDLEKEKQNA